MESFFWLWLRFAAIHEVNLHSITALCLLGPGMFNLNGCIAR